MKKPLFSGWRPSDIMNDFSKSMRLVGDRRVPLVLKLILPLGAMVYWFVPIDLIPGLPIDDIAVLLLAMRLFVSLGESAVQKAADASSEDSQKSNGPVVDTTWQVMDK
jgi:uncharacterized membrane protein YkvA (DUF1232 family)